MKKYKIEVDCSKCENKQSVNIAIGQPQTIICLVCGTGYGMKISETNPIKNGTFCYYCQDDLATQRRDVALRRKNGYKLMDFEVKLCDGCNCLDDKFLSDYFSV